MYMSVCLCDGHTGELCKNGWTDRDAVNGGGGVTHMGPRYHALDDILTFSLDKAFPQTEASPVDRGQKRPLT